MGHESGASSDGPQSQSGTDEDDAETGFQDDAGREGVAFPNQSPLFHALNAERYTRQELIRSYQQQYDCTLVVLIDQIFPLSCTYFEELLYKVDPTKDLHLVLGSPGGDGETAVRLARAAQARCRELVMIVPDRAKSAGTILCMGAHRILMGPSSDLGPVDPQMQFGDNRGLVSAKDMIAAVEYAELAVQAKPETYPIHASLLADVDAFMIQAARSALARTTDLVVEALRSNPDRSSEDAEKIREGVTRPLIEAPNSHGAVFGVEAAKEALLPAEMIPPNSQQWEHLWRLWSKYMANGQRIYEGSFASHPVGDLNF